MLTLDVETKLTFSNGAIANVKSTDSNLEIDASGNVTTINAVVEFTNSESFTGDETTSIPKEMVVVELSSRSDYSINQSKPPSATLSIQDNDKPGIRIVEIDDTTVTENGTGAVLYICAQSTRSRCHRYFSWFGNGTEIRSN